jgi:hypothetical protein
MTVKELIIELQKMTQESISSRNYREMNEQLKKDAITLIRNAEKTIGFVKFKVGVKSKMTEIVDVLQFITNCEDELATNINPKINELLTVIQRKVIVNPKYLFIVYNE